MGEVYFLIFDLFWGFFWGGLTFAYCWHVTQGGAQNVPVAGSMPSCVKTVVRMVLGPEEDESHMELS